MVTRCISSETDAGTYTIRAQSASETTTVSAQLAVGQGKPSTKGFYTSGNLSITNTAPGHDETKTNTEPAFLVSLKGAEMIENTLFRFMIKIKGDPKPRVKL